jgi:CRISPR-associated endoribonuclease Cas6
MRARLIFLVQNRGAVVPFHHQHIISDVFKGLMRDSAEHKGYAYCNFSALKGQIRVVRDGLQYSSEKVTIVVASLSKDYLDAMIAKLFEQRSIKIGELIMVPESVDVEEEVAHESPVKYLCLSPIVICSPERSSDVECKRFVSPFSDEFSDLIYESTMINMERSGLYSPEEFATFSKFQVVPDEGYLNKIKETVKKMARIYPAFEEDFMYEVRGYTLPFTLYAEPKVHEFVLNCGIGSLTKHGFGMLDIATNDFKKKTVRTEATTTQAAPLLFQRVNVIE